VIDFKRLGSIFFQNASMYRGMRSSAKLGVHFRRLANGLNGLNGLNRPEVTFDPPFSCTVAARRAMSA